jgi:hypothetical protein
MEELLGESASGVAPMPNKAEVLCPATMAEL